MIHALSQGTVSEIRLVTKMPKKEACLWLLTRAKAMTPAKKKRE